MKQLTLRLSDDLHERLRVAAFVQRRSLHSIALEGVEVALAACGPETYAPALGHDQAAATQTHTPTEEDRHGADVAA